MVVRVGYARLLQALAPVALALGTLPPALFLSSPGSPVNWGHAGISPQPEVPEWLWC